MVEGELLDYNEPGSSVIILSLHIPTAAGQRGSLTPPCATSVNAIDG